MEKLLINEKHIYQRVPDVNVSLASFTIRSSFFLSLHHTYHGGAIAIFTNGFQFNVERSQFTKCTSLTDGGAIYAQSTLSSTLKGLCFIDCIAENHGQTAIIWSNNTGFNSYTDSVVYRTSLESLGTSRVFAMFYNDVRYERNNHSSISIRAYDMMTTYYCPNVKLIQNTIHNTVADIVLKLLTFTSCSVELTNIINNTNTPTDWSCIYVNRDGAVLSQCVLAHNRFPVLCMPKDIEVDNCVFYDNNFTQDTSGPVFQTAPESFASHYCIPGTMHFSSSYRSSSLSQYIILSSFLFQIQ